MGASKNNVLELPSASDLIRVRHYRQRAAMEFISKRKKEKKSQEHEKFSPEIKVRTF